MPLNFTVGDLIKMLQKKYSPDNVIAFVIKDIQDIMEVLDGMQEDIIDDGYKPIMLDKIQIDGLILKINECYNNDPVMEDILYDAINDYIVPLLEEDESFNIDL